MFRSLLPRILDKNDLTPDEAATAADGLFDDAIDPAVKAAVLVALRMKGETATELAAAARALRARMTPFDTGGTAVLDTCGTGGDGANTFNISTAAAFVVAAAGGKVVKHGNRAVSSRSGSADVLRELGVPIDAGIEWAGRCFRETGLAFCLAPQYHPALAGLAELRRTLGVRTILNLIGPLANPATPAFQLLGIGSPQLLNVYADAMMRLGVRRAAVVCGADGLDEVSPCGPTDVRWIQAGCVTPFTWCPADFGYEACSIDELRVEDAGRSANVIRGVLNGERNAARQAVIMNAAAALLTCGIVDSLRSGVATSTATIDGGDALRLLRQLQSANG